MISDSPQGSAFPTCYSAQQKVNFQFATMQSNTKVLVKEQKAKEQKDKKGEAEASTSIGNEEER